MAIELRAGTRIKTENIGFECLLFELRCLATSPHLNFQILDAYESGVKAFKGITNKFGLTEDNIDKTMDGIEDVSLKFNVWIKI